MKAWAIGPGLGLAEISVALKARHRVANSYFALSALEGLTEAVTQGVALGYYISRLWRLERYDSLATTTYSDEHED